MKEELIISRAKQPTMTRRHSKLKPHLASQYKYQREAIELCWVSAWFTWYTNCQDTVGGTIFSDRFKK